MSAKVFSLCLSAPPSMDSLLSEVILSHGSYVFIGADILGLKKNIIANGCLLSIFDNVLLVVCQCRSGHPRLISINALFFSHYVQL